MLKFCKYHHTVLTGNLVNFFDRPGMGMDAQTAQLVQIEVCHQKKIFRPSVVFDQPEFFSGIWWNLIILDANLTLEYPGCLFHRKLRLGTQLPGCQCNLQHRGRTCDYTISGVVAIRYQATFGCCHHFGTKVDPKSANAAVAHGNFHAAPGISSNSKYRQCRRPTRS